MTANAQEHPPESPLDAIPAWLRPLLPDWVGGLRDRAFALDDIEILSRAKGGDGRTVTAYAAVFDTPAEVRDADGHYREQIHRSAFDRSIRERAGRINVFYNHGKDLYGRPSDRFALPIGTPVELRSDARGLRTTTQYNRTPLADEVLEAIKSGSMRGMSFTGGFLRSDPQGPYYARSSGELTLVTRHEIALIEYGPTPIPNYDDAEVVGVRAETLTDEPPRETITVSTESTPADPEPSAAHSTDDTGTAAPPEQESPTHSTDAGTTSQQASQQASRSTSVEPEIQQTMTATERAVRQEEIRSRMNEIAAQFSGAELDDDSQTEWNAISKEFDEHERAIVADTQRRERLAQLADRQTAAANGGAERVDNRIAGYGQRTAPGQTRRPDNIYDLAEIRQRARSLDDLPELYRDNAMRAVEIGRYGRYPGLTREEAQTRIAALLDTVDTGGEHAGTLARRILVTGSPTYERAFWKTIASGSTMGLTTEEQRALSMGSATSAQLAVPFTLDPTILLTSDGATNPLREMSRVETITGRTWEGVTSAGITVGRIGEALPSTDQAPTLAQPTLTPTAVRGFVPFSIETEQDWSQMRAEMTRLLADAKDVEEATSFVTGSGTPPAPSGIQSTLTTASNVNDGVTFTIADIFAMEDALPPRFTPRAQWLGRKNTYNVIRTLDTNGTLYARLTEGRPPELIGYPAREASAMPIRFTSSTVFGGRYLILGDWSNFLIVDKAGMDVELVPHLFSNNLPTGQRGLFAMWRNNSLVLNGNAFRILVYAT